MLKLSFYFTFLLLLIIEPAIAQDCTQDVKANEAKTKLEQGKGHGCSYAAQFYAYLCECQNKPRTPEQARMLKATLEQIKSSYASSDGCEDMGPLPSVPDCKVGPKTGNTTSGGMTREEQQLTEFRQRMANAYKIGGHLDAAQERAKRISEKLQQLSQISANISPQQIMQQYNQNMQRINQLERELRQDIANSNLNTGIDIINDYNTGNNEGVVYGTLGLLGQVYDNQQAKNEIADKKSQLQKEKEQRMLSSALQMIKELEEKSELYNGYAANSFSKEREEFYGQLAKYYNEYADHVNYGFSYNHIRWASYSKKPPQNLNLPVEKSNPTASEYAKVAERKFGLFEINGIQEYATSAVRYMNAAINKNPRNSSYYMKLSKYCAKVNKGAALDAYMAFVELNPSLMDEEEYRRLSHEFIKEIHENYVMFVPGWRNGNIKKELFQQYYVNPKKYLQDLIDDPSITNPLLLYTDFYGGMVFHSRLEALLYIDAKYSDIKYINLWQHVGAFPRHPNKNVRNMTRTLQLCAMDNAPAVNTLIELGADPEMKIDGKNAIEIAIENGSIDVYKKIIHLALNPDKYSTLYNQSALPVIDQYIKNSFDPSYISNISSTEQEEKVALWMLHNFDTLISINSYENFKEIYDARQVGKVPELKAKGTDFGMLKIVKSRSSHAVNKEYEQLLAQEICTKQFTLKDNSIENIRDYELSQWIKEGGLPMDNFLFPPAEYTKELSREEKELEATLDSISCVLCLDKKSFNEVMETVISYLNSNKAEAFEKYLLNKYKEAYASFKETKRFEAEDAYLSKSSILRTYNNAVIKNGFPKMDMLEGRVLRPIDQMNETYAHLALLYNRYYSFKAMNEAIPLATITNRKGKTIIDYLQIMIVENPQEYSKYALLPGIKDYIDWQKPFNGKTVFDILVEEEAYDILADLAARNVIKKDLTPYAFQMAKYGKFKEIAEISRLGNLDLTVETTEGFGGNLLHALVTQVIFVDQHYYKNGGWYKKENLFPDFINIPTVESIQERYDLDAFLNLDKDLKRNDGNTPYKTFRFYVKQFNHYDKEEFKKWKRLLK
ncbi:MAG: hypothetical protein K9J30_11875 [Bacteroidales bacterium]|nr:hypothetical protein [Bacteroidales bacterium]